MITELPSGSTSNGTPVAGSTRITIFNECSVLEWCCFSRPLSLPTHYAVLTFRISRSFEKIA